jgi:hypothetical protein
MRRRGNDPVTSHERGNDKKNENEDQFSGHETEHGTPLFDLSRAKEVRFPSRLGAQASRLPYLANLERSTCTYRHNRFCWSGKWLQMHQGDVWRAWIRDAAGKLTIVDIELQRLVFPGPEDYGRPRANEDRSSPSSP